MLYLYNFKEKRINLFGNRTNFVIRSDENLLKTTSLR